MGADVSDAQLHGARDNLNAAGLEGQVALLKVSVVGKTWHVHTFGKMKLCKYAYDYNIK